jgi:chromate transporter
VLAIVIEAVIRIARRAFKTRWLIGVSVFSFVAIGLFGLPFPVIVLGTALAAGVIGPYYPEAFAVSHSSVPNPVWATGTVVSAAMTFLAWLMIWFAPLGAAVILLGPDHRLVDIGLFFGRLAAVTFGGAYALLAWLAQAAVESKGWLSASEMVDGLGLAETTPGPTILVTQFVGFIAAMRAPSPFSPVMAGIVGAALTVWMTFIPSYMWIFSFAPFLDILRNNRRLAAALTSITAIVVGVVAWVAFWFGLNVLFADVRFASYGPLQIPEIGFLSVRWDAVVLAGIAAWLLLIRHRGLAVTLGMTMLAGLGLRLALPAIFALN